MTAIKPLVWTFGHSTRPVSHVVQQLVEHGIDLVVDVRSSPHSARAAQFNREVVGGLLREAGIDYRWQGASLGGRPANPAHYDVDGHALYGEMAKAADFVAAMQDLEQAAVRHRPALMCSEDDPVDCHRNTLIGTALRRRGSVELVHLRRDGTSESDADLLNRLTPAQRHLTAPSLFDALQPVWRSTHRVMPDRPESP